MTGKLRLAALESRILLDAAAAATVAEHAADSTEPQGAHDHAAPGGSEPTAPQLDGRASGEADGADEGTAGSGGRTVIVVDTRAGDLDALLAAAGSNVEVHLVGAEESGIAAIADILGRNADVDALHIVSHGSDGSLSIGRDTITAAGLANGQGQGIATWSAGLSAAADLLIYGCDVAAGRDGALLVQRLASLTGADVAASSDATGSAALGGDWDLEVSAGSLETDSTLVASLLGDWNGLLAAPTVADSATVARTVAEDGTLTVSGLTVSGTGTLSIEITLTEAGAPPVGGGQLSLDGSSGATVSMSGTAAEINAALAGLQYTTSDNFNGAAQLAISVSNAEGGANSTVAVSVTPVNDTPTLDDSRVALSVQEGGAVAFGTENFELRDADLTTGANLQVTAQEMVKLSSLPTSGTLTLNGSPVVVGTVFSYADLGNLVYTHNGSDVQAGGAADSFTVTLNDGGGSGDIGPFTIDVDISPKNSAPTISADLAVYEGEGTEVSRSTGLVTNGRLLSFTIDDQEIGHADALDNLTFVIDQVNLDGEGVLFIDLDDDGQPDGVEFDGAAGNELLQGGAYTLTWTQVQKLRFAHDGSEPNGVNPSFRIRVTDAGGGEGPGAALSAMQTVEIKVLANDDDPVLETNAAAASEDAVVVDAGTSVLIDNSLLRTTDVDGGTLVYTITTAGQFGDIEVFSGGSWVALGVGGRFTQSDIDSSLVRYTQSGDVGVDGQIDFFEFEVRDSRLRAFNNAGEEGAVRDSNLAIATNRFHFSINGTVEGEGPHTPPPTTTVDLVVLANGGSNGDAAEEDFVAGSIDTHVITTAQLEYQLASSDGTFTVPADETFYRLTTLAQSIELQLDTVGDGSGWVTLGLYDAFTQADIDNGRIRLVHDGSEIHQDSFGFSISSGQTSFDGQVFEITIAPTNDRPVAGGGTKDAIPEGGSVRLLPEDLAISDADLANEPGEPSGEAAMDELWFRVSELPVDGELQRWTGTEWVAVAATEWMHSSLLTISADGQVGGLRYVHDGGDVVDPDPTVSSFVDQFTFLVRDDLPAPANATDVRTDPDPADVDGIDANLSEPGTVVLNIAPLNDAPIADVDFSADGSTTTTDNGGANKTTANQRLELAEGATATITNAMLQAVDPDSSTVARQFRITQDVQFGTLYLNSARLGIGSTFTQDDIDSNRLTYEHGGSEDHADFFLFVVSDSVTDHVHNLDGDQLTPTGGGPGESRFDIIVPPGSEVNDIPTVEAGPPTTIDVIGPPGTNPVSLDGVFAIGDADLNDGVVSGGEQDFMHVTVRLLDSGGNPVDLTGSGSITITDLSGATQISYTPSTGEIVFQGTLEQVRAALNSVEITLPDGDNNTTFTVETTADDRLRDGSGALIGAGDTANGDVDGTDNEDGSPINAANNRVTATIELRASDDNDAPTVTVPGPLETFEDVTLDVPGLSIDDVDAFDEAVTVTLGVTQGTISVTGGGASVAGNGTATVTLTGTVAQINASLGFVAYTGQSNWFGTDTLTIDVNDGGALGTGGAQTTSDTVAITVRPLNDAPEANAAGTPVTISEDGFTPVGGFVVGDTDIDGDGGVDTVLGETDFVEVTIRLLDDNGDPLALAAYQSNNIVLQSSTAGHGATVDTTFDGNQAALKVRGSLAQVNAFLAGLEVDLGSGDEVNTSYSVQILLDDRIRNLADGALDGSGDANGGENPNSTNPATVTGSADVPADTAGQGPVDPYSATTSNLPLNLAVASRQLFLSTINDPANITATDVTVTEGSSTVTLNAGNAGFTVADADNNGGVVSGTITVSQGAITSIGGAGGTLGPLGGSTVTFSGMTLAELNSRLQALTVTFADPDGAGPATAANFNGSFTVTVAVNDGGNTGQRPTTLSGDTDDPAANPGDYDFADGTSNELVTTRTITVTVDPRNDAPDFGSSTGVTATVDESPAPNTGTAPVQIVTGADVGDVDLATTAGLDPTVFGDGSITAAVTGADSSEQLSIDLDALPGGALPDGVSIGSNGSNGSALVINLSESTMIAEVNALLEAIRYRTTSDTLTGAREIVITLSDGNNLQGGNDAGGPAPLTATLTATITVNEQNDPPAASDNTVTTAEDTAYVFTAGDFNFTQPGGEADTLNGVRIDSLPAEGRLMLNGVAVEAGDVITVAQINGGQLSFVPDADENNVPYATFTFSVQDSRGGFADTPNTMTVNVTALNDPPVLAGTSVNPSLPIDDDGSGTVGSAALLTGATAQDVDITQDSDVAGFGGGRLTISFTDGYQAGDRLTVAGGVLAGMAGPASGGTAAALIIDLADTATSAQVAAILEAIRYSSVDADPTAGGTDLTRSYSIVLSDGNNNGDGGATDGTNDAGGPAALDSNALSGTISFRFPPTATDNANLLSKATPSVGGNVITDGTPDSDAEDPVAALAVDQVSHGLTGNSDANPSGGFTVTGSFGTLQVAADGTYTYMLNMADPAVAALAPDNPDLVDVFTYRLVDTDGTTDTATLTITITGQNTAPVARDNSNSVVGDDPTPATGNLVSDDDGDGVDSDPESDPLTVTEVEGVAVPGGGTATVTGSYGTLTLGPDGSYSYVVDVSNPAVLGLPPLGSLTETFTYTIDDGEGGIDTAVLTIAINAPNTAPTALDNANAVGSRDTAPATGNLVADNDGSGTDSDPESDTLSVTRIGGIAVPGGGTASVAGSYGTLTVGPDGGYSYLLNTAHPTVASLPQGATLTESFVYTIDDGNGGTDTATLTITVTGVNTAPAARDNANTIGSRDTMPAAGNLVGDDDGSGVDSDPESDPLTVTEIDGVAVPGGGTVMVAGSYGALTIGPDGSYSYVVDNGNAEVIALGQGRSLIDTFTYAVGDGRGGMDTAELVITITGPAATPPTDVTPPMQSDPSSPMPMSTTSIQTPANVATTGTASTGSTGATPAFARIGLQQQLSGVVPGFVTGDFSSFSRPLQTPIQLSVALQDRVLAEGLQSFAIPGGAFRHTDPTEQLAVEAALPDGSALPSFIIFDSETGTFTVNTEIPRAQGLRALDIRVVGRDSQGNEASTVFTVHFSDPRSQGGIVIGPQDGAPPDGEGANDGQASGSEGGDEVVPEEAGPPDQPELRAEGRTDTMTQLRLAGRQAVLAERDALLSDLLTIVDRVA